MRFQKQKINILKSFGTKNLNRKKLKNIDWSNKNLKN